MITVIHGNDIVKSRAELTRLIEAAGNRDVRRVDGKGLAPETLLQAVQSNSMFGGDVSVVIEHLFGPIGRKTKLIHEYADILKEAATSADIVVWEGKELGVEPGKALGPAASLRVFNVAPVIFSLLDSVSPNDPKRFLDLLPKALESGDAPERIAYMLADRVRQLIAVKDGVRLRLSPFQLTRLTSQSRSFTMERLLTMHARLTESEYAIKTGASPFNARQALELSVLGS